MHTHRHASRSGHHPLHNPLAQIFHRKQRPRTARPIPHIPGILQGARTYWLEPTPQRSGQQQTVSDTRHICKNRKVRHFKTRWHTTHEQANSHSMGIHTGSLALTLPRLPWKIISKHRQTSHPLARKVEAVFDLEPWVNHTHKELFSTPIDDLRQRSVRYLTIWLAVAAPIAKQARDNQTRTSSNQLENYFHIQNT